MTVLNLAAVAIGGFFGAIIRYQLSKKLNTSKGLPYGTALVNLLGCLLVGFVFGLQLSTGLTFLLVSGLAGALTTFSTWLKEILGMSRVHEMGKAFFYLMASVFLGFAFVYIGFTGASFF